ncbi:transketolase [Oceanihabitans sediminis]|uniref:transketolase n=2 Tax=Pseudomonadati TaxID=3379134 RepID=A0A368P5T2_9FLAO|nr:transketolase [Oceanihabitans sediminis]MDX1278502.1 transketolase [Oceanihabitans sediminis]MDX1772528.1 transketolase [Oceanihabitans sediminis]RBP34177.1 transketolase [Oceanihabitans sediminis]RCU57868.1 transketolase [Oceanihabitans sediminis]
MNKQIDQQAADNIRALAVAMVEKANSGHPGGPMGGADFMHILYSEFFNFDPTDMTWAFRDRFFMDAGHLSTLMYAQYYLLGNYAKEDIANFRQWGSITPGHPEVDFERGIENTSGPLGQGHTMGVGAAIAAKYLKARFGDWMNHKVYGFISDGGIQEEVSQGAGRIAGHLGLSNFIMFFDSNDIQLSTSTDEVTTEDTAMKYESWGWKVVTIDGHNHDEIRKALKDANNETEKPTLIIGKTVIGKGSVTAEGKPFEGYCELHGQPISNTDADYEKTLLNLGANPEKPFDIYKDVQEFYKNVIAEKTANAAKKKAEINAWRAENKELADKLDFFLSGELPELDFSSVSFKEGLATRAASSAVLGYLAENVENMIVSSADLSNSDKTDGFLKKTHAIQKNDFTGSFLQAGVAELTMACIANGIALHGGVIPVVATFFVFSDYMKPAIRLSALQELGVKYVWTHDAFRVGEDGPTHQPIEQEAQIRLLEKLKNHSGDPSFLALRPADSAETVVAWKMALENKKRPTGLILSRQGIKDIEAQGDSRYNEALAAEKGGYLVKEVENPDVVLIANGSEVSTLVAAAEILEKENNLKVNIASVISEGVFRLQSKEYQNSVIPKNKPLFGLTAGLPVNLEGLVGENGKVFGLEHFGYSAPAKVLDDKFGFTGEKVSQQVLEYLKTV